MIALIVTIIVLLILAGVSIATLTENNGIIDKANSAKNATEQKQVEEQIEIAIVEAEQENRNTTIDDVINKLIDKDIIDNASQVDKKKDIINTNNGFVVEGMLENYMDFLKPGETATSTEENNYRDGNKDKATIPEGFKVSAKAGETTIDSGLVVIAPDGSEFVWVPVPTVISDTEANGTTNKAMAIQSGKNYIGLLYEFTSSGSVATHISSLREPAYLTDSDYGDSSSYNNIGITEVSLQEEYNKMIEKVYKYGGFYVGRYETSLNGDTVQSKKEKIPTNPGESNTYRWYGLYAKQKEYKADSSLELDLQSVQGSMIWGSQYDAMMHWMQKSNIDVTSTTPIADAIANTTGVTGSVEKDKLNNIYDILGNKWEWTLEAYGTKIRVLRGVNAYGLCLSNRLFTDPPSSRYASIGSRLTLYIKQD